MPIKDPIKRKIHRNEYMKKYLSDPARKSKHIERVNRNKVKRIKALRDIVAEWLLAHPCIDCGNSDIRVLEFDHLPGSEKRDGVCNLINFGLSQESLLREINKCEIRCANCHAIKTYERAGGSWRDMYLPQSGETSNPASS